mgnify:CR=1 FL=1
MRLIASHRGEIWDFWKVHSSLWSHDGVQSDSPFVRSCARDDRSWPGVKLVTTWNESEIASYLSSLSRGTIWFRASRAKPILSYCLLRLGTWKVDLFVFRVKIGCCNSLTRFLVPFKARAFFSLSTNFRQLIEDFRDHYWLSSSFSCCRTLMANLLSIDCSLLTITVERHSRQLF